MPLIPGLKTLIARHAGDETWRTIRPPHLRLTDAQCVQIYAAFDACGVTLPPSTVIPGLDPVTSLLGSRSPGHAQR